jgi:predicted metal-dependent hydrolase
MRKKNKKKSNSKDTKAFSKKLQEIFEDLKQRRNFEIRGQLQIGVITNLDALAIIKGNRIYVNFKARHYPKTVLRYIVSHEVAHIISRHHRRKFWEIVARIYPKYEDARKRLILLQSSTKNC